MMRIIKANFFFQSYENLVAEMHDVIPDSLMSESAIIPQDRGIATFHIYVPS